MSLEQINNFLTSPELTSYLLPFKIVFIIVSLIFIYFIIYYVIKQVLMLSERKRMFKDFFSKQDFDDYTFLFNRWKEIEKAMSQKGQLNYRLAIVNSEGLIFDLFKTMKYEGKELKEMYSEIQDKAEVENTEIIPELMELANKVKTNPSYYVDDETAERVFGEVKKIVEQVKII
ncbi:MAG: hypothetical protein WC520_01215 [Candidatus Paceibacterota bacterium]